MSVILRNAITGDRQEIPVQEGQTVKEAVENSGFVAAGDRISVRDQLGHVVDNDPVIDHKGKVLSVGLSGDRVRGGAV